MKLVPRLVRPLGPWPDEDKPAPLTAEQKAARRREQQYARYTGEYREKRLAYTKEWKRRQKSASA